jgi:hypothetical protein
MREKVGFTCYLSKQKNGECTLFLFYPNSIWDECELTIQEAVKKYPPQDYKWLHISI